MLSVSKRRKKNRSTFIIWIRSTMQLLQSMLLIKNLSMSKLANEDREVAVELVEAAITVATTMRKTKTLEFHKEEAEAVVVVAEVNHQAEAAIIQ